MKGIKLWKVLVNNNQNISVDEIENVSETETENQLEEVITQRPELLMKGLKLVGRQTETQGGPLDLLGVDADGRLVVFELKRGTLTREAVAQVIDYSSYLATLEPDELSEHITARSGKLGIEKIDSFLEWYQEEFGKSFTESQRPAMVLVGLGVDERTIRMVSFLTESDLDISLITFHGFKQGDDLILARQVEVQSKPPGQTPIYTKKAKLEKLKQNVQLLKVEDYYYDISSFFRDQLPPAYEWPNPSGYSYTLMELTDSGTPSNRVYISLYLNSNKPGQVHIALQERAIEAASDNFDQIVKPFKERITRGQSGVHSIWIKSKTDWENLKSCFASLCESILMGWKRKQDQQTEEEFESATINPPSTVGTSTTSETTTD